MAIEKGPRFSNEDIFVDYDFEEVMFRWEHKTQSVYRKFYGELFEAAVDHTNPLFFEALLAGIEIAEHEYHRGKPKP